jgi:hypothetical protein
MSTHVPEEPLGAAGQPPPPARESQESPGETSIPRETSRAQQPPAPPAETPEEAEATEDAMEELRRLDEAEKFDASSAARPAPEARYFAPRPAPERTYAPPRPPQAGPAPLPSRDFWGQTGAPPQPAQPAMQSVMAPPRELKTLEDLNAAYPYIGDGETYLRVERKLPTAWHGQAIAGFLENVHEKLSMEDFTARYGGTSYLVDVWRFGDGQKNGDRTPRRISPRVEIKVLGAPAMGTIPRQEQEEYQHMQRLPGMPPQGRGQQQLPDGYPQGEAAEVQIKRLEIEAERASTEAAERRRLAEEARAAVRPPAEMFGAIKDQADRTVSEVKDLAQGHINLLREANADHLRNLREKEAELAELRGRLQDAQRQAIDAQRYTETEQTKSLKERYEGDIRRLIEEHSRASEKTADEHKRAVAEMTARHVEERQRITEGEGRERERLREDANRREQFLKDDNERRERAMKDQYEARINDYERQSRREIDALKDAHHREVEVIKSTESSKSHMSEQTAKLQVGSTKDQLHRAETELSSLRRECEELRQRINKPVIEAISEAHQLAKMTGLVDKDDVEVAGSTDEKTDWSKVAAKGVMGLIEKLPDVVKGVADMRQQNAAAAAHAQQQQQQHEVQVRHQAEARDDARRGLPPPGQHGRRQGGAPPMTVARPQWGPPPAPGHAPHVPAPSQGPVMQPPAPVAVTAFSGTPPTAGGPPAVGSEPVAMVSSPVQPTPTPGAPGEPVPGTDVAQAPTVAQVGMPWGAPAPQPTPRETAPPAPPPAGAPGHAPAQITQEQAQAFVSRLEGSIREGLITPKLFARAMVDEVGLAMAAELVGAVKPDELLRAMAESQAETGHDLKMLTHEGKQYVRAVFTEATALLRAQGAM